MLKHYNKVTQDQLGSSIVEIVDEEEPALKLRIRKVCYLPYHEVVHLDKSTSKVRVVFDASFTRRLNDSPYVCPGPLCINFRCIA